MFLDLFNEMIGICIVTEMVINTLSIKSVVVLGPDYVCFFFFFQSNVCARPQGCAVFWNSISANCHGKKIEYFFSGSYHLKHHSYFTCHPTQDNE